MRILRNIVALVGGILMLASCDDNVSYAELLNRENLAVNNFLADQVVLLDIPADTVFEVGPDAPYYRLDEDGQLYMQVLNAGTPGYKVQYNEQIYFRYGNYSLTSSLTYGTGIQTPLEFLPIDCEVNLVVKSTVGWQSDQTDVIPYLYRLTYQRRE